MDNPLHLFVLVLHALGAMVIVGSSFVSVLMLVNRRVPVTHLQLMNRVWTILGPVIGLQVVTGLYLMSSEWADFGHNYWLWLKIILLVSDGLLGGVVIRRQLESVLEQPSNSEVNPQSLRTHGWVSFMILVTIATIGVLIAA